MANGRKFSERHPIISTVGSFTNPLESLKWAFWSAPAAWTYAEMSRVGSFAFRPIALTGLAGREFWGGLIAGKDPASKFFRGAFGGFTVGGTEAGLLGGMETAGLSSKHLKEFSTVYRKTLKAARWKRMDPKLFIKGFVKNLDKSEIIGNVAGDYGPLKQHLTKLSSRATNKLIPLIERNILISRIGSVGLPIVNTIMVSSVVSQLTSFAFKAATGLADAMDSAAESLRSLEFGGYLGAGYQTSAAATDRQRAIQEIQRSHTNGRRVIGNEANMYSELI